MRLRKQPICRINRNIHNIQLSKAKRIISTLSTTTATIAKTISFKYWTRKNSTFKLKFFTFSKRKIVLWRLMKEKPAFYFIKIFFLYYTSSFRLYRSTTTHTCIQQKKNNKSTLSSGKHRKKRETNDFNFRKIFISQMMWIHFSGHFSTRLNIRLNMMNNNGERTIYLLNHVVRMSKWTENRIVIINNFLSHSNTNSNNIIHSFFIHFKDNFFVESDLCIKFHQHQFNRHLSCWFNFNFSFLASCTYLLAF